NRPIDRVEAAIGRGFPERRRGNQSDGNERPRVVVVGRPRSGRSHEGRRDGMSYYGFRPYVPVAQRRLQALREVEKLKKEGQTISPVVLEGRKIASNFWGKAWCDNLERYSDYAN